MNKKIRVLQIGHYSWFEELSIAHETQLDWHFLDVTSATEESCRELVKEVKKRTFDVVLCTESIGSSLLEALSPVIEAHACIVNETLEQEFSLSFRQMKCPFFMRLENKEEILDTICQFFFSGQNGSKFHVQNAAVNEKFSGGMTFLGEHRLVLNGNFSDFETENPILTWKYSLTMFGRNKKIWLEYETYGEVSLRLTVRGIRAGTSQIMRTWVIDQVTLKQGFEIPDQEGVGDLNFSLSVQGEGEVRVGPLHYRDSRGSYGEYLLGGNKVSDVHNEELFYYFHPGDLKPPLNVYFSGYRSAEGFEGFYMMKNLGAPFLLITDPRLEGGSFYLGSSELEQSLKAVIEDHLKKLNFSTQELTLSGLSMGTFGALYYGSFLEPHSIIVGKPLVNLGSMAEKHRIIRPNDFSTSLDLLQSTTGRQDQVGIETLNQIFWTAFDTAKFDKTQFVMAYMQDDDYDDQAYGDIIAHLSEKKARVIGKGIPGRHNDNSPAITEWFYNHYRRILEENFHRGGQGDV